MSTAPTSNAAEHPRQVKQSFRGNGPNLSTVVIAAAHLHCGSIIIGDALGAEHRLYFRDIKTLYGLHLAPSSPK